MSATPLDTRVVGADAAHVDASALERRAQPRAVRVAADLADHRDVSAQTRGRGGLVAALAAGKYVESPAAQRLARTRGNGPRARRGPHSGCRRRRYSGSRVHGFIRFYGSRVRRRRHTSAAAAATMTAPVVSRRVGSCTPICASPAPSTAMTIAPEGRCPDGPASTCQAGAADHDGRDGFQLEADAGVGIGGGQASGLRDRRQPRQRAAQREGHRAHAPRVDARQARRFVIGADGDDVASDHGVCQRPLRRRRPPPRQPARARAGRRTRRS